MVDPRARHLDGVVERKRVRVAEVEAVQPLGDDDRVATVGREVHVVGIVDRDRAAGLARARVDRRQAVAGVVRHVERPQVPRRDDVLRQPADVEVLDDLVRRADRSRRPCRSCCSARRRAAARFGPRGAIMFAPSCAYTSVVSIECAGRESQRRARARGRRDRAARRVAAEHEDRAADGCRGEIGARDRERSRRTHVARRDVDRDDPVGRRPSVAPRPPTTYTTEPSDAAAACVVGAGSFPSRTTRPLDGVNASTSELAVPVLERPARNHEPVPGGRDGRVAERVGEMRDDVRCRAGPPGDDRVEPARAGVAADDVGGAADRRGARVRARRREVAGERRVPRAPGRRGGCRRAARRRCRRRRGRRRLRASPLRCRGARRASSRSRARCGRGRRETVAVDVSAAVSPPSRIARGPTTAAAGSWSGAGSVPDTRSARSLIAGGCARAGLRAATGCVAPTVVTAVRPGCRSTTAATIAAIARAASATAIRRAGTVRSLPDRS